MENLTLKVKEKLSEIASYFISDYQNDENFTSISLFSGRTGVLLILSQLFKYYKDYQYLYELRKNFNYTVYKIQHTQYVPSSFCAGLAGWGWMIQYLSNEEITVDSGAEFLQELDNVLYLELDEFLKNKNFDLLHGALGIGLYYLKRKRYCEVEKILIALYKSSIQCDSEIKWKRFDLYYYKDYVYDFGLAHGICGILYYIEKCYSHHILPELCKGMLQGGINFYLNNIQDINQVGSFFPSKIRIKDYKTSKNKGEFSRLAWCYGDLGILYTLLRILKKTDLALGEDKIIKMLLRITKRKDYSETRVLDSGFCHGISGINYLFMKLFKMTNDLAFKSISDFWIKKNLSFRMDTKLKTKNNIAGYLFYAGEFGWLPISDIIGGIGGVGLLFVNYLNYLNKEWNNDWDECFFLS